MDNKKIYTIYCLQLEDSRYYVGRTKNSGSRIDDHFQGRGCKWTQKYRPIKIYWRKDECDIFDEHKYTIKMMDKFGIDNVRGASYCRIELSNEEINSIKSQIWNAKDLCFQCGGNHFVRSCRAPRICHEIPMEKMQSNTICKTPRESNNLHKDSNVKRSNGWFSWIQNMFQSLFVSS